MIGKVLFGRIVLPLIKKTTISLTWLGRQNESNITYMQFSFKVFI